MAVNFFTTQQSDNAQPQNEMDYLRSRVTVHLEKLQQLNQEATQINAQRPLACNKLDELNQKLWEISQHMKIIRTLIEILNPNLLNSAQDNTLLAPPNTPRSS